jgi:hypothetical protein
MFYTDSQFIKYKNNNCKATYIFYDWKTNGNNENLYVAFSSLTDCPGCSGLVDQVNRGLTGQEYISSYKLPFTCGSDDLFDNQYGTVSNLCPQCGATAPSKASITYLNLTGKTLAWGTGSNIVSVAPGEEIASSKLYPANSDTRYAMSAPDETAANKIIKYIYNIYPGMFIEKSEDVSGGFKEVTYRNITKLVNTK